MNPIVIAIIVVGVLGLAASLILALAGKLLYVPSNEKALEIEEILPGVNCGACGYAGCAAYATAVATGQAATNLCIPGGDKTAQKVAALMGEEAGDVIEMVANVACHGAYDATHDKYEYAGVMSCAACDQLHQGRSVCSWGCLGFGDCVTACQYDAISVKNGVAQTDYAKCTGCGACAAKCPKGLIQLVPRTTQTIVVCSNRDRGNITRKNCIRGCIGCMRCERICPNEAIRVHDNLAAVDFEKCQQCGQCVLECPTNAIEQRT